MCHSRHSRSDTLGAGVVSGRNYHYLSLTATHSQLSTRSLPSHSLPSHSLPSHSLPSHSLPSHSLPSHSLPPRSLPPRSLPPHSLPSHSLPSHSLPPHSLPSHSLPPLMFIGTQLDHSLMCTAIISASQLSRCIASVKGKDATQKQAARIDHISAGHSA